MQWYLASLLILLILVGTGVLVGSLLLVWLPARMQPAARIFLSVPLGWTLLTLVATLLGWFGPGYARCHCAEVTLALAAAGAWVGREWLRRAGGDCLRLATFCVLASYPILGPLLRGGTFALYNDTYLYLGHALWLQHHGFLEPAHTDGGHPLWGTVMLFQNVPLRMGASFLLGWVHTVFGLESPYEVFPAVAALGVICGALGVGATILAACPGRWLEAWLTALAVAVTVNGFPFGAAYGFLPQTWGLAFAATAFGLRGLELGTRAGRSGRARWGAGITLGLCVAASMHCYWDLLPLEGPALACSYLLPWPGGSLRSWAETWRQASVPLFACVLTVNLEWQRAARGILYNIHALAANPVAWPAWDFPAHALGLKSSVWEGSRWITNDPTWPLLLGGCSVVVLWSGLMLGSQHQGRWRHWLRPPRRLARWQWRPLVPVLIWSVLTGLLLVYFRYVVPSPWQGRKPGAWPDGVGQSWSQYKVTIWGSFAAIGLLAGLGTGWTMRTGPVRWRAAWIALLAVWCGTGLGWNFAFARRRGEELLYSTGLRRDPFTACLAMRQKLAAISPDDWVYLDWPSDDRADKFREVMVLLLSDHPLASDWSTGVSILFYVTPADARRAREDCQWLLRYQPPEVGHPADPLTLGGMTLEKTR